ncbi:aldo/keto reductase [Botrimarina hoheduenensis]|uniref:Pyridoxal 4-dehydrogenase n=1 Tax=Botrimarina hoheduenensis TaxID=2528000 RepID=A0A5C5WAL9_9BACT|nr:aldo/keto reductase [Botrimarina hoheduenensis]TWT47557.1 Pyridoxal 4-dehydrogenase [Botrimarina hoheduenensis]
MHPIRFGNTGLLIPPVVFGTSNLGNLFVAHTDEVKLEVTRAWFDLVNQPVVVDTAGKYGAGMALEVLGRNLRTLGIDPKEVVISNKLAWVRQPLPPNGVPCFEPGAWVGLEYDAVQRISYEGILGCWEEGNRLLGTPYRAELVSVHDPDEYLAAATSPRDRAARWEDLRGAYQALQELKQRGEVQGVGVGVKDWRILHEVAELVDLDWVMIGNSLTLYSHPPELLDLIETLANKGVAIINSAVFHSGFLVGGDYFDYRRLDAATPADQDKFAWRERFHDRCAEHGVAPAAACLRFAISPPGVHAIAMNSSRRDRIAADIAAIETPLPPEFWSELKAEGLIDLGYPYV